MQYKFPFMRSNILIVLFSLTSFYSCTSTLFLLNGVKKPRVENRESIKQFLHSLEMDKGRQVIANFEGYQQFSLDLTLTKTYVFNADGKFMNLPGAANACGPAPLYFLNNLDKDKVYDYSDSVSFSDYSNFMLEPDGSNFKKINTDSVDFIVLITWAKWIGKKVLKRDVKPCVDAALTNTKSRIMLVLLNVDQQEVWSPDDLARIKATRRGVEILPPIK